VGGEEGEGAFDGGVVAELCLGAGDVVVDGFVVRVELAGAFEDV
jgi:hypothetical protein